MSAANVKITKIIVMDAMCARTCKQEVQLTKYLNVFFFKSCNKTASCIVNWYIPNVCEYMDLSLLYIFLMVTFILLDKQWSQRVWPCSCSHTRCSSFLLHRTERSQKHKPLDEWTSGHRGHVFLVICESYSNTANPRPATFEIPSVVVFSI